MNSIYLQNAWYSLFEQYATSEESVRTLASEVSKRYSEKNRHYHTLQHVESILRWVDLFEKQLQNPTALRLAAWFHDVIYDAFGKENERKSADFAEKCLSIFDFPAETLSQCYQLIMATEKHLPTIEHCDQYFFLDFDLCILGQEEKIYKDYTQKIRKEYFAVPAILFESGRKKVLQKFLSRERLFFSVYFFENFEKQARENLQKEIIALS